MFGTVIIDAYKKDEKYEMAEAINDICSPSDHYGWSSAGIYSFWDYSTHEILYIGLASDLCERFKQHNGLAIVQDNSCKFKQIEEYFETHNKLGYSIFVQSPLSQPLVHRNKDHYKKMANEHNSPIQNFVSNQGIADIKRVEGILIESYKKANGDFPAWNKVGGSIEGQNRVLTNNINIVKAFSNPQMYDINPIVSRSTIRELSKNPTYEGFESFLHGVRMFMLNFGMNFNDALKLQIKYDHFCWYEQIYKNDYMNKNLIV